MNNISLIGRLTSDPELNYTTTNKACTKFNIAVNRMKKDEVDFINCEAWEKQAELIAEYCKKGDKIGITGMLRIDVVEKDSKKTNYSKIVVLSSDFISDKSQKKNIEKSDEKKKTAQEINDDFPF